MLSPFIPRALIVRAWRKSYVAACKALGLPVAVPHRRLQDIRVAEGGRVTTEDDDGRRVDVAFELCKYMTKDLDDDGERKSGRFVDPRTYADALIALDGLRRTQGSRGFMALRLGPAFELERPCRCCGVLCPASEPCKVLVSENIGYKNAARAGSALRGPGLHGCGP
jgi:hypothetical protein